MHSSTIWKGTKTEPERREKKKWNSSLIMQEETLCEDKVGWHKGILRDTLTLGRFFKVGGTNGCLCYELWLLIGANLMNAGCCVETDALCKCGRFQWLRFSPSLEHQEEENIWQVTKLCGEKGKPGKRENVNSCLFIFFPSLVNLWVTCVCLWGVCACVSQLALLERMSICLSRPFCFGFLAPPALQLSISVQASGT